MVFLTADERIRFALWLRQEAESNDALARQANTMDGLKEVVRSYRMKAMAASVMADELDKIHEESAGSG